MAVVWIRGVCARENFVLLALMPLLGSLACGAAESDSKNHDVSGGASTAQGGVSGENVGGSLASGGRPSGGTTGVGGVTGVGGGITGGVFNGGATSGGSAGFSPDAGGAAPTDTRPPAPPWQPPFPLGEPGWMDSKQPLCSTRNGIPFSLGLWADERGVFALVSDSCRFEGRDLPTCSPENRARVGANLQFNDGSGWRTWFDTGSLPSALSGFRGASVVVGGFDDCGLALIDGPHAGVCQVSRELVSNGANVFVVDDGLAYTFRERTVLEFDGTELREVETLPEDAWGIWADATTIVVAGQNQAVYQRKQGDASFSRLSRVPAGDYGAVWGFAADDIWLANTAAQLVHYDGAKFTTLELELGNPNDYGARRLWGENGTLYWLAESAFGRVKDGVSETLLSIPTTSGVALRDFWGRAEDEVFISGSDPGLDQYRCGSPFFLHFDGAELHRF